MRSYLRNPGHDSLASVWKIPGWEYRYNSSINFRPQSDGVEPTSDREPEEEIGMKGKRCDVMGVMGVIGVVGVVGVVGVAGVDPPGSFGCAMKGPAMHFTG